MNHGQTAIDFNGWTFLESDAFQRGENQGNLLHWKFQREATQVKRIDHIDFFISYRRDGGATIARLLYEVLRLRGLSGFIDTEQLEQGDYSDAIVRNIKKAGNFILVVSPGALDSKWVVKEIEAAITASRKIIPIFTDGVTGFPENLDPCISALSKENAIFLDHSNFESKYKQLVDWLETPHVKLVNACFRQWGSSPDGVDEVFAAWKSISSSSEVSDTIAPLLRKAWQGCVDARATQDVLASIGTRDLKSIARELTVEHKGNRSTLLNAINDRLRGGACLPVDEDRGWEHDGERYYRVCRHLAMKFKSREKLEQLKDVVFEMDLVPDNWRSSKVLMEAVFDSSKSDSIDEIFDMLGLDSEEIKSICAHFCSLEGRSIAAIRANFKAWVDYVDRVAP